MSMGEQEQYGGTVDVKHFAQLPLSLFKTNLLNYVSGKSKDQKSFCESAEKTLSKLEAEAVKETSCRIKPLNTGHANRRESRQHDKRHSVNNRELTEGLKRQIPIHQTEPPTGGKSYVNLPNNSALYRSQSNTRTSLKAQREPLTDSLHQSVETQQKVLRLFHRSKTTKKSRLKRGVSLDPKQHFRIDNEGTGSPADVFEDGSFSRQEQFFTMQQYGCNNSNGTKTSDFSRTRQSIQGKVIRVEGDGRCLFRSLVTGLSPDLQKTPRDDFGSPLRKDDAEYETHMADILRAKVVKLMLDNAHFYGQLDQTVLNADRTIPAGYSHFRERLRDMTLTSTMPGDLELNATSTALIRQVLVLDADLRPVVVYGKDRYPESEVVAVRYTRLGPDVGHYDAVIPDLITFDNLHFGAEPKDEKDTTAPDAELQPYLMDRFKDLLLKSKNNSNDERGKRCPDDKADHKSVQVPSRQDLTCSIESNPLIQGNPFTALLHGHPNQSFQEGENNMSHNSINISLPSEKENENLKTGSKNKDCDCQCLDSFQPSPLISNAKCLDSTNKATSSHAIKKISKDMNRCRRKKINDFKESAPAIKRHRARDNTAVQGRSREGSALGEPSKKILKYYAIERKTEIFMSRKSPHSRVKKQRRNSSERSNKKANTHHPGTNKEPPLASFTITDETEFFKKKEPRNDRGKCLPEKKAPSNPLSGRYCYLCNKPTPLDRRSVVLCTLCGRMAHKRCVGSDRKGPKDDHYFLCKLCLPG